MPIRNKKSLKAISQHIESGKGFGSLSSSSDPATGVSAASEEDFVDLVGDDDDICFNEENQSSDCDDEDDDDEVLTEHVTNFWTSTIDWGKVELSFKREGESRRSIQRKRLADRAEANEQLPLTDCCARRKVANQPDFLEQREWLREVVENKGHQILYFPKFHCELNYIEMVWAYVKSRLRRHIQYSCTKRVASSGIGFDSCAVFPQGCSTLLSLHEWIPTRISRITIGLYTEKVQRS